MCPEMKEEEDSPALKNFEITSSASPVSTKMKKASNVANQNSSKSRSFVGKESEGKVIKKGV